MSAPQCDAIRRWCQHTGRDRLECVACCQCATHTDADTETEHGAKLAQTQQQTATGGRVARGTTTAATASIGWRTKPLGDTSTAPYCPVLCAAQESENALRSRQRESAVVSGDCWNVTRAHEHWKEQPERRRPGGRPRDAAMLLKDSGHTTYYLLGGSLFAETPHRSRSTTSSASSTSNCSGAGIATRCHCHAHVVCNSCGLLRCRRVARAAFDVSCECVVCRVLPLVLVAQSTGQRPMSVPCELPSDADVYDAALRFLRTAALHPPAPQQLTARFIRHWLESSYGLPLDALLHSKQTIIRATHHAIGQHSQHSQHLYEQQRYTAVAPPGVANGDVQSSSPQPSELQSPLDPQQQQQQQLSASQPHAADEQSQQTKRVKTELHTHSLLQLPHISTQPSSDPLELRVQRSAQPPPRPSPLSPALPLSPPPPSPPHSLVPLLPSQSQSQSQPRSSKSPSSQSSPSPSASFRAAVSSSPASSSFHAPAPSSALSSYSGPSSPAATARASASASGSGLAEAEEPQHAAVDGEVLDVGRNKLVTVSQFRGATLVHIREYYVDDSGARRPGKKGIALTTQQWQQLMAGQTRVQAAIEQQQQQQQPHEGSGDSEWSGAGRWSAGVAARGGGGSGGSDGGAMRGRRGWRGGRGAAASSGTWHARARAAVNHT